MCVSKRVYVCEKESGCVSKSECACMCVLI